MLLIIKRVSNFSTTDRLLFLFIVIISSVVIYSMLYNSLLYPNRLFVCSLFVVELSNLLCLSQNCPSKQFFVSQKLVRTHINPLIKCSYNISCDWNHAVGGTFRDTSSHFYVLVPVLYAVFVIFIVLWETVLADIARVL